MAEAGVVTAEFGCAGVLDVNNMGCWQLHSPFDENLHRLSAFLPMKKVLDEQCHSRYTRISCISNAAQLPQAVSGVYMIGEMLATVSLRT